MRPSRLNYGSFINNHVRRYPTPSNLNYFWGFGSLALFFLISQIVTGLLLAVYYTPTSANAFNSVQHIMRDVNYGWLIRYIHSTGSSFFFIVVYAHIGKALYYGSYLNPRHLVWNTGIIILILMMAIAFLGYVLPWGQMSFWAATVITNFVTVIPGIGENFKELVWGSFCIGDVTLKRFFVLHFILPFVLLGMVIIHLILLHSVGSNNPLGIDGVAVIPFYPYYFLKDLVFLCFCLIWFFIGVCYYPNDFLHPDNYIKANPMVTPAHIVPEWYFLPYYAMLRAIPHKAGGIIVMLLSILVLFSFPIVGDSTKCRSGFFRPLYTWGLWLWFVIILLLGWLGSCPIEYPFVTISRWCTLYYFGFILFYVSWCSKLESSIIDDVLQPRIIKNDNYSLNYSSNIHKIEVSLMSNLSFTSKPNKTNLFFRTSLNETIHKGI